MESQHKDWITQVGRRSLRLCLDGAVSGWGWKCGSNLIPTCMIYMLWYEGCRGAIYGHGICHKMLGDPSLYGLLLGMESLDRAMEACNA